MIAIVLVAHVPLASAMRACARHVLGEVPALAACDVKADEDPVQAGQRVADAIADVDRGDGVLVLTDIKGATPANIAVQACARRRANGTGCDVLAGLNGPMLLRALTNRSRTLSEVRDCALLGGMQGVVCAD